MDCARWPLNRKRGSTADMEGSAMDKGTTGPIAQRNIDTILVWLDAKRCLIWLEMFLFSLGLITGFVEQQFNSPRMGLAAHLY
jgi:hypothetical protein